MPKHTLDLSIGQQILEILSMGMGGLVQLEKCGWVRGSKMASPHVTDPRLSCRHSVMRKHQAPPPLSELLSRLIDSFVWAPSHYLWLLPFLVTEQWLMQFFFKRKKKQNAFQSPHLVRYSLICFLVPWTFKIRHPANADINLQTMMKNSSISLQLF